jgi:hypothetical protein
MDKELSVAEIHAQFSDEWILVEGRQTSPTLEVLSGKVLCHSKDRDEVYRQAVALRPARFAIIHTGAMPPNTAIVV